jgi:formylglycine-generating enzyme required for sulfatase activity
MFIAGSTQLTQNVDLDDLRSDKISDYGYMTYTATITDEDDILETPKIGTVTSPMAVTVKDTKADMQSAVITVTAISQNYYPFTITVNIGVTGKTLADITVTAPDTIIYGETLGDPKAETEAGIVGTFTFRYTGTLADGNYTQIDPSYNKPVLPGSYYVTAILTSDTHAGMRSVGFIIERKTLTWNDDGAVSDKIYDLRSVMPVINQPTLNGIINNDDVTVEEGRALALLPYAGTHIVTGDGYGIDGADAWKYYEPLEQPCFGEAVINKAPAPFFTFPTSATAITYGQTLADSMLNITYNYNGTFAWTTPAAVPIVAQSGSGFSVIFTPSAYTLANYEPITTLTTNVSVTVHRANPVVTWPSDLTATFGQLLGDVSPTGNGSGIPAGRFEWVTPENSVGDAGIRLQTLVYRPNDTANYNSLSHNVNLTVNRANPVVTLPTNLTATFGQRLYEISLPGNGSGVPAGIFAWDSPANLVGGVGRQTHPIIFTPNDTANYNTLTRGVDVTVHRANPVVTWPTNLTAIFWQSLSDVALPGNGTSNTPGTFVWINPNDSVGITGTRWHAVRFVPHDAQNYNVVTGNTTVTVTLGLIEMVYVEGGRFMYGRCARGNPTGGTLTDVGSFFIGKYQVTQDQWRDVMTDNSSGISVNPSNFSSNPAAGEIQGRRPVEQVSWYDVIVFCNRLSIWENLTPAYEMQTAANPNVWSTNPNLWGPVPTSINDRWDAVRIVAGSTGYRLPTEYQWEFAAKGGRLSAGYTGTASDTYFIYSGSNNADSVGWYDRNSGNITREVGRLAANELGLYDMSGNVWEWCWDLYSTTSDFRVLRGGCWYYNEPTLRSADQLAIWSNSRNNNIGFRLVRP